MSKRIIKSKNSKWSHTRVNGKKTVSSPSVKPRASPHCEIDPGTLRSAPSNNDDRHEGFKDGSTGNRISRQNKNKVLTDGENQGRSTCNDIQKSMISPIDCEIVAKLVS